MSRKLPETLTDEEQRVLEVIAELESAESTTFLQDIARHSGIDPVHLHKVLQSLTRDHNLVTEVQPVDGPDLGPQYVLHHFD
jgi:DNA-binding IscR family transcriptional regulator